MFMNLQKCISNFILAKLLGEPDHQELKSDQLDYDSDIVIHSSYQINFQCNGYYCIDIHSGFMRLI